MLRDEETVWRSRRPGLGQAWSRSRRDPVLESISTAQSVEDKDATTASGGRG